MVYSMRDSISYCEYVNGRLTSKTWIEIAPSSASGYYSCLLWFEKYVSGQKKRVFSKISTDSLLRLMNATFYTESGMSRLETSGAEYLIETPSGYVYSGTTDADLLVSSSVYGVLFLALSYNKRKSFKIFDIDTLNTDIIRLSYLSAKTASLSEHETLIFSDDGFLVSYTNKDSSVVIEISDEGQPEWREAQVVCNEGGAYVGTPLNPMEKELSFDVLRDVKLRAMLSKPDKSPHVVAVFIGGSGDYDLNGVSGGVNLGYREFCLALAEEGVLTLRLESLTSLFMSENSVGQVDLSTIITALNVPIQYLLDNFEERCIIIGHSLGAILAVEASRSIPKIKGAILINSPGRKIELVLRDQQRHAMMKQGYSTEYIDNIIDARSEEENNSLYTGACSWMAWISDLDPIDAIVHSSCDVLAIRGELDEQVFDSDWNRILESQRLKLDGKLSVCVMQDMRHNLLIDESSSQNSEERLTSVVIDWLNKL